jgi:hypothetical protein
LKEDNMTNFERLMQCKTPEEAFQMLRDPGGYVAAAWCALDKECDGRCDSCLKSWILSEFSGQKSDEYKPRHMKEEG